MPRPAWLRGSVVALLLAALTAACTTIPQREFATYKDTFAKARTAGETVVLDYGVAVAQFEEIKARRAAAKPEQRRRGAPFDPGAPRRRSPLPVDHVLVRMQAWDVVARYNDLLTALAEGKPADELAGGRRRALREPQRLPAEGDRGQRGRGVGLPGAAEGARSRSGTRAFAPPVRRGRGQGRAADQRQVHRPAARGRGGLLPGPGRPE